MVSHSSTKDHKGKWNSIYYSWLLEELHGTPQGALWGSKVQVQNRTWGSCFVGLRMKYFGVPWLRMDWSILTQKNRVWYASHKFYPRDTQMGRPWEAKEIVYHRGSWGSHVRNLTFPNDFAGCYVVYALKGGANVSTRPL